MKKTIKAIVLGLIVTLAAGGCGDEEAYPVYQSPDWAVSSENNTNYYVNMTAIVRLPDNLAKSAQPGDKLAAFAGEECRGIGNLIDGKYFVTIKGMPEDNLPIHFKYYSVQSKYMYRTENLFPFETDAVYGTVDVPGELPLSIMK